MAAGPKGLLPLLVGSPEPLQVTFAKVAFAVQPAICRLAALTSFGIAPPRKAACTSWIALIALLTQSPEAMNVQFAPPAPAEGVARPTVAGVAICCTLLTV